MLMFIFVLFFHHVSWIVASSLVLIIFWDARFFLGLSILGLLLSQFPVARPECSDYLSGFIMFLMTAALSLAGNFASNN